MDDDDLTLEPDEDNSPTPRRRSLRDTASELWHQKPGPRAVRPQAAPLDTKAIVDGLDRLERNLGFATIVFALFLTAIGYVASKDSTTKTIHDGAKFFLVANLAFIAILLLGLILRRRALLGFGCFFYGLEQVFSYHAFEIGLPFLAFGGWLIWRAQRKQKQDRLAVDQRPGELLRTRSLGKPPKPSKRYTPPKRAATARRR